MDAPTRPDGPPNPYQPPGSRAGAGGEPATNSSLFPPDPFEHLRARYARRESVVRSIALVQFLMAGWSLLGILLRFLPGSLERLGARLGEGAIDLASARNFLVAMALVGGLIRLAIGLGLWKFRSAGRVAMLVITGLAIVANLRNMVAPGWSGTLVAGEPTSVLILFGTLVNATMFVLMIGSDSKVVCSAKYRAVRLATSGTRVSFGPLEIALPVAFVLETLGSLYLSYGI